MAGESISIPILTPGADAAARNIKQVGNAAAEAGGKLDFAAGSLKLFNEQAAKSAKADQTLVQSAKAHAKALSLIEDAENVLAGKATKTTKLFADQQAKLDSTGKSATVLAGRLAALTGTGSGAALGGSGMTALVGAGVALSGQITTLAFGLGGLALAAYGVAKPIEKAAQSAGGLQKNLHTLDPQQQAVAKSLLGLEHQYDSFQKALQPQILTAFNDGFRIAGHLMHDVQPIAKATGNALDQVLLSVDKEFQSGTWQQFFAWMAQQAGPDLRQLGQLFTDLLQVLPGVAKDLQPIGQGLLTVTDDAVKATGAVGHFYDSFQKNVPISNEHTINFLRDLDRWTVDLTNHIPGAHAVNNWLTAVQHGLTGTGDASAKAAPKVRDTTSAMAHSGAVAAYDLGIYTQEAKALNVLAASYEHALTPLENYIGAQITERDDLKTLNQALQASHDKIGLKTQAERASFSAAQQYIKDTTAQGNAALAAHKGIDAQISSIQNALPRLEAVRGKTAAYKQELGLLKDTLDKLRAEKQIQERVEVIGDGSWHLTRSGVGPLGSKPLAAGGLITGGLAGRDSVPIMAMPGEVVVPTRMVSAGAVDHLRGSIPGFAGGGIVGSYHGPVAGLPPWTSRNQEATITAIGTSIAKAFASSFITSAGAGAGVQRWAPLVLQVLALLGQPRGDLGVVLSQMGTESGGNPNAINLWDSNAAAGDPSRGLMQVIGSTFNAYAGPYRGLGIYNPLANVYAGLNYAIHRYGAGWTNILGHGHGYDQGGYLPPGLSLAYNGTGRPEQVIAHGHAAGAVVIQVHVSADASVHPAETGRIIADRLKAHIKRGGTLYPAGVAPR
jgi:hypothetical protein